MLSVQTKKIVFAVSGTGFLFLLGTIFFVGGDGLQKNNDSNSSAVIKDSLAREYVHVPLPVRLKIPKINIDTTVEHVGLTSLGAMDVPKDPAHVAWFSHGASPGQVGSAVISGHYGWKNNIPVVFDSLHLLQQGDRVYIEDENGVTTSFLVREVRTYTYDENAADVFASDDGKAHLNLITCQGVWDKVRKSYLHRFVVFTDKETED